jgi:hypothetical protein
MTGTPPVTGMMMRGLVFRLGNGAVVVAGAESTDTAEVGSWYPAADAPEPSVTQPAVERIRIKTKRVLMGSSLGLAYRPSFALLLFNAGPRHWRTEIG